MIITILGSVGLGCRNGLEVLRTEIFKLKGSVLASLEVDIVGVGSGGCWLSR